MKNSADLGRNIFALSGDNPKFGNIFALFGGIRNSETSLQSLGVRNSETFLFTLGVFANFG